MPLVRGVHRRMALGKDGRRIAVMHCRRRQKRAAGMPVRVAVVLGKRVVPALRMDEVVKAGWIARRVLRRFELRFEVRVVVADARSGQRAHDAEILIRVVQVLCDLDVAAITVRGELARDGSCRRQAVRRSFLASVADSRRARIQATT